MAVTISRWLSSSILTEALLLRRMISVTDAVSTISFRVTTHREEGEKRHVSRRPHEERGVIVVD
jgi:hypothetical protein